MVWFLVECILWCVGVTVMMGIQLCDSVSKVYSFFVSLSWFSINYGIDYIWVVVIFQWVDIMNEGVTLIAIKVEDFIWVLLYFLKIVDLKKEF